MRAVLCALSIAAVGVLAGPADLEAQGMSIGEFLRLPDAARGQVARGLSAAERKALHEQFRALPEAERRAVLARRGRGAARRAAANLGVPTLQYDSGSAHGFRVPCAGKPELALGFSCLAGNAFDSGFGNPHSLTTVTFQLNGNFSGGQLVVFDGAPAAGVGVPLTTVSISTAPINTLVSLPLPGGPFTNLSGSFHAMVDQSGSSTTPSTTFVNVAVDTVSAGFGFHGVTVNTLTTNTNPTVAPGNPFNAIVRVTGNNLPVELMEFAIDD